MSDERLRELERRWQETGSINDEGAYLSERIRAGQIAVDQVQAIARMGYPAAMLVLGRDAAWLVQQSMLTMIQQFGEQSLVRALLILLGAMLREMRLATPPAQVITLIEVSRTWLASPTDEHAQRVFYEAEHCMQSAVNLYELGSPRVDGTRDPLAPLFELAAILGRRIYDGAEAEDDLFLFLRQSRDLHPCLHDEPIRAVLRERLVPWLLGYGDPLNIEKAGTP